MQHSVLIIIVMLVAVQSGIEPASIIWYKFPFVYNTESIKDGVYNRGWS